MYLLGLPCVSVVKNPVQEPLETWIQSLGQDTSLEEGMATHSSILAWRIPMIKGAWSTTVHGVARQEGIPSSLSEGQSFCSVHAFNWLDEAHPHKRELSAFWSLLFRMLISSRNTQNSVWQNVWAPCCGPVKLTHKISHHICQKQKKNTIRTSQFYRRPAGIYSPS